MAPPANSYRRVDITQEAEDVRDIVYDVSPEERPFMMNAPQATAENTTHQWHEDVLDDPADPSSAGGGGGSGLGNAWSDGDDFNQQAITSATRLNNYCQIQRKDFLVTRRARLLNKYGQRDELARQVVRKGRELLRDGETVLLYPQAKVADDGAAAPLLGGVFAYIANSEGAGRTNRAGGGADPTGDGTNAPTDGTTPRALSESGLLGIVDAIYKVSSEAPDLMLMSVDAKQRYSNYMFSSSARIATQYQDQGASPRGGVRAVGAVDTWVTNTAVIDVAPNRFMRDRDTLIYNTAWADCTYFSPIQTDAIAKQGDSDRRMILMDHTLTIRNRRTMGTFADVDHTAPMVA